eukprot:scaffold11621_cov67-Phaeocystis_antarctica.AAC.4
MIPVVEHCPQIARDLRFCDRRRLVLQFGRAHEHWLGEQVGERGALLDAVEEVDLPVAPRNGCAKDKDGNRTEQHHDNYGAESPDVHRPRQARLS